MASTENRVVQLQIKLAGVETLEQLENVTAEINNELKKVEINSQAFNEMSILAKQANVEVQKVDEQLANVTSVQKADSIFKIGQGLVGAFQAAAGASIFFGKKTSAELQKVITTVGGLFAVTDGLKKLTEAFSAENIKAFKALIEGFKQSTIGATLYAGVQKIVTAAQWLWNAAMAANPIGAIIVTIAALGAAVYGLTKIFGENEEALNKENTAMDGLILNSKEAVEAHNNHIETMKKLNLELSVLKGNITETDAAIIKLAQDYNQKVKDINKDTEEKIKSTNGIWNTLWNTITGGGAIAGLQKNLDEGTKIILDNAQKTNDAAKELDKTIETAITKDAKNKKKDDNDKKKDDNDRARNEYLEYLKISQEGNALLNSSEKSNRDKEIATIEEQFNKIKARQLKGNGDQATGVKGLKEIMYGIEVKFRNDINAINLKYDKIDENNLNEKKKKEQEINNAESEKILAQDKAHIQALNDLRDKSVKDYQDNLDYLAELDNDYDEERIRKAEEREAKIVEIISKSGEALSELFNLFGAFQDRKLEKLDKETEAFTDSASLTLKIELDNAKLIYDTKLKYSQDLASQNDALNAELADAEGDRYDDILAAINANAAAQAQAAIDEQNSITFQATLQAQYDAQLKVYEERKAAAEKKAANIRKAQALSDAVINLAVAIISSLKTPFLTPFVAAAGALQIATIAATPTGFKDGGYTATDGSDNEVAGTVHKNEFVAPAYMVRDPRTSGIIQTLENIRVNGFQDGGYTSSVPQNINQSSSIDYKMIGSEVANALMANPIFVSVREIRDVNDRINVVENRSSISRNK